MRQIICNVAEAAIRSQPDANVRTITPVTDPWQELNLAESSTLFCYSAFRADCTLLPFYKLRESLARIFLSLSISFFHFSFYIFNYDGREG